MKSALLLALTTGALLVGCVPDAPRPPAYPARATLPKGSEDPSLIIGKAYCSRLATVADEQKQTYNGRAAALMVLAGVGAVVGTSATIAIARDPEPESGAFVVPITAYAVTAAGAVGSIFQLDAASDARDARNAALDGAKVDDDYKAFVTCLDAWKSD
jgi:hypothetical protein